MLYELDDVVSQVEIKDINPEKITIGIMTQKELESYYTKLGFSISTVRDCVSLQSNFRCAIDIYDGYSFGYINLVDVMHVFEERDSFSFYIKNNLFLIIPIKDKRNQLQENMESVLTRLKPEKTTLEKVVYVFFDNLLCHDSLALETIGYQISLLEDRIVTKDVGENFHVNLLTKRKELLILRNYYEQLIDIGEALEENENELFPEENLRYFKIFTDRMGRLSNNAQLLRDNLVQIREAHQAFLDYNININMKMFTLITIIFLPLTLIVGWYGMNFTYMPELHWKYGYVYVIGLTLAVVIFCIIVFRKKKIL